MHVDRALAEVVEHKVLFDLADAANCALKNFFDENTLLRVHDLIVALFKLAVDLDVLDVQHCIVRESFLKTPEFTILCTETKPKLALKFIKFESLKLV